MNSSALAPALADCRERAPHWEPLYDRFVGGLRASGVAGAAPRIGDSFPDFALPDVRGRYHTLAMLLEAGPAVLSFNRGGWCPFCTAELTMWGAMAPELRNAGGHFVSIAGEVGGRALKLAALLGDDAAVLCDVDHGLALEIGLVFRAPEELLARYRDRGLDLADVYGTGSGFFPVPATYVIDRGGVVRYAFADPDFRVRAEPADVIEAVRTTRN